MWKNTFTPLSCKLTTCWFLLFSVDITTYYRDFHGDLNETFFVGEVDEKSKNLVNITHECLAKAIDAGR